MTDPIDTAREEGIALGLAMAGSAFGEWYSEATTEAIKARILTLAPVPPHVAAARVLLDDWKSSATDLVDWEAVWRAMAGAKEMLPPALFFAALEQIAREEG